jgi:integrase
MPPNIVAITDYIWHLVERGLRPSTIGRRVAAISYACRLGKTPYDPTTAHEVKATLRGARRRLGGAPTHRKAAVTDDMLVAVLRSIPDTTLTGLRDRALLAVGWAAALRRSELVALDVEDLEETSNGILLHIRRSKTDQAGEGQTVGVPGDGSRIKPVPALRAWLAAAGITSGPVFKRVRRGGVLGERLKAAAVAEIVKDRAHRAGFDVARLSGHSLRAG